MPGTNESPLHREEKEQTPVDVWHRGLTGVLTATVAGVAVYLLLVFALTFFPHESRTILVVVLFVVLGGLLGVLFPRQVLATLRTIVFWI